MLNKRPIFIVGFQYGGSNILLNLLRSHPNVCSPRGEIQEVFKGKGFPKPKEPLQVFFSKLLGYLPILISQRQDIFSLDLWQPRKQFSETTISRIDRILFYDKFKAMDPSQNLYKSEGVKYSKQEVAESRILCKLLNGNIFLTDMLYQMYPDAVFIAVVRNGFALCEGHNRRGRDIKTISQLYEKGCQKIISDSIKIENYHIIKLEDLLENPAEGINRLYKYAHLNIQEVNRVRLETKKVLTSDGKHEHIHGVKKKQLVWYDIDKIGQHFEKNVNINQIKRLTEDQMRIITDHAYNSLKYFSYI